MIFTTGVVIRWRRERFADDGLLSLYFLMSTLLASYLRSYADINIIKISYRHYQVRR